jgi:hypothetical protein
MTLDGMKLKADARFRNVNLLWNAWFICILIYKFQTSFDGWDKIVVFVVCLVLQIVGQYLLINDSRKVLETIKDTSMNKSGIISSGLASLFPPLKIKKGGFIMEKSHILGRVFIAISAIIFGIFLFQTQDITIFIVLLIGIICYLFAFELLYQAIEDGKRLLRQIQSDFPKKDVE